MRTAAVKAILFAALSLFSNGVQAAPWCAHFNTGLNACSFYSFGQCMTAVWGVGDFAIQIHFQSTPPGTRGRAIRATIRELAGKQHGPGL
jgi:hypothetical protein